MDIGLFPIQSLLNDDRTNPLTLFYKWQVCDIRTYVSKNTEDGDGLRITGSCCGCHIRVASAVVVYEVYLNCAYNDTTHGNYLPVLVTSAILTDFLIIRANFPSISSWFMDSQTPVLVILRRLTLQCHRLKVCANHLSEH